MNHELNAEKKKEILERIKILQNREVRKIGKTKLDGEDYYQNVVKKSIEFLKRHGM